MGSLIAAAVAACTTSLITQETPPSVPPDPQAVTMSEFRFVDESDTERTVQGRVLVEAQDGGVLVEDREGSYWNITPIQLKERTSTEIESTHVDDDEQLAQLGKRYETHTDIRETDHYLVLSNAGPAYTDWCTALLERYYKAFFEFWAKADVELQQPTRRLVVLIWRDKSSFDAFYKEDVGLKTVS